jgi:acyl-CoA thioesterase
MAQPEKRFRCGACEVSIFRNVLTTKDGRKVTTRKASFQKRYKTPDGEWKTTNTLDPNDIPKANLVLHEAYKYLALDMDIEVTPTNHNHEE